MLKLEADKKSTQGKRDVQTRKHQAQLNQAAPAAAASSPSPPSSSSASPSHEFSFTISLHPPVVKSHGKSSPPPFPAAIDLSPADEIFFHGHLLPLHLISHLPVSPRSSTNSLDNFTLPVNDDNNNNTINVEHAHHLLRHDDRESRHVADGKGRGKSKSFSLFAIPKWRKGRDSLERDDNINDFDHQQSEKRKSRFELVKRYIRFVKPVLSLMNRRLGSSSEFIRPPSYSYSGNLRERKKGNLRGRRGEFSAPASMRTSPANSGLLVASGAATPTAAKSDSTMEELQAAIQAAIAHCKNSIAAEDQIKQQP